MKFEQTKFAATLVFSVILSLSSGCAHMFQADDVVARRKAAEQEMSVALNIAQAGGNRDSVLSHLRKAVEIDPRFAVGRAAYGNALAAIGNLELALVQFSWAINLDPDNADYKNSYGILKLREDKPVEAVGFLVDANLLAPQVQSYRDSLLIAYVQIGRWDRALQLWNDGAMGGADDDEKAAMEIILLAVEDRYDEAATLAKKSAVTYPKDSLFPFLEGLLWEGLGNGDSAIRAYEKAAALNPASYDLRRLLTILYLKNGYYQKAERTIRRYLSRSKFQKKLSLPEKVKSYYELADAQFQTGRYRLSKKSYFRYRKMIQRLSQRSGQRLRYAKIEIDPIAHFANGVIEEKKEQYPQAVSEYLLAVKGDPQFVMAWERLGQSYLLEAALSPLQSRPPLLKKGKQALEQAITIKRNLPHAYMLLGNATYQLAELADEKFRKGLLKEALFLFGQADSGTFNKYTIRVFQGKISDSLEEYGQALKYYQDARRFNAEDAKVEMLIGHTLMKLKKYDAAVKTYFHARELGADRFDSAAGLALAYERLENFEEADKYYLEVRSKVGQKSPESVPPTD